MESNDDKTRIEEGMKGVDYIDLTPTWEGLMPAMIAILEGAPEAAKVPIREELTRLARAMDKHNAKAKEE